MKVLIIIQARFSSTRLPGKVLLKLSGKPMLWHLVQRMKQVKDSDELWIATSVNPADQPIVDFCKKEGINCYRGPEQDVLKRFVELAEKEKGEIIIRVTGDNPLTEPSFIAQALAAYKKQKLDYITIKQAPIGVGGEIVSLKALQRSLSSGAKDYQREHVTPYVYEHPEEFSMGEYIPSESFFQQPAIRLTVDEEADLALMREIYKQLYRDGEIVSLKEVLLLLKQEESLLLLNKHIKQKSYKNVG